MDKYWVKVDISGVEELQKTIKEYAGNAEEVINEVLHNEGGQLIQDLIRRLMPESGAKWKGKKGPAKTSKSLRQEPLNLAVKIRSTKNYQYLYFPNDGSNTQRHYGDQQFFFKGAEAVTDDIIDRCLGRLTEI